MNNLQFAKQWQDLAMNPGFKQQLSELAETASRSHEALREVLSKVNFDLLPGMEFCKMAQKMEGVNLYPHLPSAAYQSPQMDYERIFSLTEKLKPTVVKGFVK